MESIFFFCHFLVRKLKMSPIESQFPVVKGVNFDDKVPTLDEIISALKTSGLQGTQLATAIDEINRLLPYRLAGENNYETLAEEEKARSEKKAFIWLTYTSNLMSCGLRETFKFLCKYKLVDAICTTGGGVEEDFMKILTPFGINKWEVDDRAYRVKGWNRTANMVVPNSNYCALEDWIWPIMEEALEKQNGDEKFRWTPSKFIDFMGSKINDENSVYYWCHKNQIPVFAPSISDGAIGDNLYFFRYGNGRLVFDLTEDMRRIKLLASESTSNNRKSAAIVLGGGVPKSHILTNGKITDLIVYISTGTFYDGSESGGLESHDTFRGRVGPNCKQVYIWGEASMLFSIVVTQSFAKYFHSHVKPLQA